jgi:hypothetical protein
VVADQWNTYVAAAEESDSFETLAHLSDNRDGKDVRIRSMEVFARELMRR